MVTPKNIVIIGGAHGGPSAAACARSFNESARITLVEQGPSVSWIQADLKDYLGAEGDRIGKNLLAQGHLFRMQYDIDVRLNCEALSLDMEARCVSIREKGVVSRLPFDTLVYAGGATSKKAIIPGLGTKNVCHFRNLNDVTVINDSVAEGAKKAVILGCGLYGIQAAKTLVKLGFQVAVIEKSRRILPDFSLFSATKALQALRNSGIEVILGQEVTQARQQGIGHELELSSGAKLAADLIVVTIGSEARTQLLEEAGAAIQANRCARVTDNMLTTLPGVYACGSAVSVTQRLSDEKLWIPQLWMHERSAQVAGQNAAQGSQGNEALILPVAGTQLIEAGGMWFARTGLSEKSAKKYCGDFFYSTVHGKSSQNWRGGDDISIRLMTSLESGCIIGGEIWGKEGVARRIDLIAVAIIEKWHVGRLVDLEMCYAARLGPTVDPLKEAARQAVSTLNKKLDIVSPDSVALWMAQGKKFDWLHVGAKSSEGVPRIAKLITLETLRDKLPAVDVEYPLVISSKSGRKAKIAQQILHDHGHANAVSLDGGLTSWNLLNNLLS